MPFGPFISQEEKDRTNAALQRNYGNIETPSVSIEPPRSRPSRYSSGAAGGAGQFNPSSIGQGNTNRSAGSNNRRGSGVRNRGGVNTEALKPKISSGNRTRYSSGNAGGADFGVLKPKPNRGRGSRYSSGAKGTAAATGAATGSQLSAVQPSIEELRSRQNAAIEAYGPTTSDVDNGGGGGGGGNGRNETRTSQTGVVQTGTQTGLKPMTMADVNSLLSPGFTVQDPYSSNQLPTTSTNLYTKDPSTVTFETGGLEGINTGASQQTLSKDLFASGGAIEFTEATPGMPTSAKIEATQTEGGANLVQSGEKSATDWLNRSVMDNSDENVRRRAAMLDTDVPILQAMRNQEAIQGRVYAGGKHYSVNPNRGQEGESDFMEISAEDARARSFGKMSAEDLKNKYVSGVTEGMKSGELPANIPNLDVESEQPATVSPVDTSTAQPFTIPGDDYQPTSTRRKGGLNLFK